MPEDYDRQIAEVIKRVRVRDEYLSGNGNCFSYRRDRRSVRDVLERPPFGFFAQDQNRQRRDHEGTSAERKHALWPAVGRIRPMTVGPISEPMRPTAEAKPVPVARTAVG